LSFNQSLTASLAFNPGKNKQTKKTKKRSKQTPLKYRILLALEKNKQTKQTKKTFFESKIRIYTCGGHVGKNPDIVFAETAKFYWVGLS
jgi:hypothetical protein